MRKNCFKNNIRNIYNTNIIKLVNNIDNINNTTSIGHINIKNKTIQDNPNYTQILINIKLIKKNINIILILKVFVA